MLKVVLDSTVANKLIEEKYSNPNFYEFVGKKLDEA